MKKRAHERTPLDMKVQFLQFNGMYPATIKNISQNGMYIESMESLPFHSKLDVFIPFKSKLKVLIKFNNDVLEIPVRVKRLVRNDSSFTGMGVMLLNTSYNYMHFMSNLNNAN